MSNYQLSTSPVLALPTRASAGLVLTNIRTIQRASRRKRISNLRHQEEKERGKSPRLFRRFEQPSRFCGAIKSIFVKTDSSGVSSIQKTGLPCRLWSCPVCGPRKAKQLRSYLIQAVRTNSLDRLLTLTLNPRLIPKKHMGTVPTTGLYITSLWNHFLTNMKRKIKRPVKYIWVKQFQKNGNAHLHVLINTFLPKQMLVHQWSRIGGGHILDIEKVNNLEAAAVYVSSYLVSGIQDNQTDVGGFVVGERRYGISRTCIRPNKNTTSLTKIHTKSDLPSSLTIAQFFDLYDILTNPERPDGEYFLASHQEPLHI